MTLKYLIFATLCTVATLGYAQGSGPRPGAPDNRKEGQRCYKLMVCESDSAQITEYNRGLNRSIGNRNFLTDVLGQYRTTFTGQAISSTSKLLDLGISAIVSAAKDKRPDWQNAINNECRFVRKLPMQTEILDFYKHPSTVGPLDPRDMLFNGFGCRQVIEYLDADNHVKEEEVFYVRCRVRTDSVGITRMLNHSKFVVEVDSLRFAPFLCDLPNDSLGMETDSRIDFDFAKRQNLTFNVDATITSSWINQAMQVYNNQELGTFSIVAKIDPEQLDAKKVFVYSGKLDKDNEKKSVTVTGDCFLVPRSYVGSADMKTNQDSWGTGQYKVEMQISESCQINSKYYQDNEGKWVKDRWNPEWKKIKHRKHSASAWNQILGVVGTEYAGTAWVTTLLDPMKTVIVQTETGFINGASATAAMSAASAASSAMGTASSLTGAAGATATGNTAGAGSVPGQ
jgi:hypothetical protein